MTNPAKAKGDRAEREIAALLALELGIKVERKLGAGRAEDTGDLYGLEDWTAQVCYWDALGAAFSQKPVQCQIQQNYADTTFGVTFIRMRGPIWRAVMTVPQWATVYRELG